MRTAIFHDYFVSIGGAEKLVLTLARELDAEVITTDLDERSIKNAGYEDVNITSLGSTPKASPLKQLAVSLKFARCDFSSDYDFFVFSGNWCHYGARRHKPNLWYCHTPVRTFYDLKEHILKDQRSPLHRVLARTWVAFHSLLDRRAVGHVDRIVTNSQNTRRRIWEYYGREASVVYPPISTREHWYGKNGDYWLSVNRLHPVKRIPLQLKAFSRLPEERLKIVGGYSSSHRVERHLEELDPLPSNVELLGEIPEERLKKLYAGCRGFIATAMDEDFGMTPLEAMASGKPVVAVRDGGYLESVEDGVTGRLVEPEVGKIVEAVREVSKAPERYREACVERAKKFDEKIFLERMRAEMGI